MNFGIALLIAAVCFAADQISKWWVLDVLDLRNRFEIDVNPYVDFVLARNTGVNFGLFASGDESQQWFLAAVAAAISVGLLIWSWRTKDWRIAAACGLVVGGALGNALDRITEGAVIDFLNVECCGFQNPYAFNVADTTIFLGAVLLAGLSWRDAPEGDDAGGTQTKTGRGGKAERAKGAATAETTK